MNNMDWFEDVIEKHHPTRNDLIDFCLRHSSCSIVNSVLEYIEYTEGKPIELWHRCHNAKWKLYYAISLTIETKSSGTVLFYYPNGSVRVRLIYNNGELVKRYS